MVREGSVREFRAAAGVEIGAINYTPASVVPAPALEDALRSQLEDYTNCEQDPGQGVRYFYNAVDLNRDGLSETIVYLVGSYACGSGGCTLLIFRSTNGRYELCSRVVLAHNPILVSHQATNGWRDLILYVAGGGAEGAYHVLKHSGSTYPENPSVEPALEAGAVVSGDAYIANEIVFGTQAPVLLAHGCIATDGGLLLSEGFGELRVNLEAVRVVELLGAPQTKGPRVMWEADALYHQTWRYPAQGLTLDMVSESADDALQIASIRVGLSSTRKTRRGIGIGDSYAAVEKQYGRQKDDAHSDPPFTFVAGSPYGGLVFSFEEDKVTQIFLGQMGE